MTILVFSKSGQQLNELEDFKLKKEDRIAMVAAMEEHMKQSDEDQKEIIENIRLKAIVDKDRWAE